MLKKIVSNLVYLAAMLGLGFAIYTYVLSPKIALNSADSDNSALSTQSLFASQLLNTNGVSQDLSAYKGKIIVLNFWATWCPPCREEMPELSQLHTEYQHKNVVVLGIAVDELALVREFSLATPVSYPLLVSENADMALAEDLGNSQSVLPYTVIIDASGAVTNTYFGRINKSLLESALRPLLPT